jgi:arylsulfatase A-like enzyme
MATGTARAQSAPPVSAVAPPDIVLIVSDDQGWADFPSQGATDLSLPNLEKLAAAGVRFNQGYVTAPQCIPSRAGLLTGRYQQRSGLEANPDEKDLGNFELSPTDPTIAEVLRSAGYRTGIVGKWHLGEPVRTQPFNRGFEWCAYFRRGLGYYYPHTSELRDLFRDASDRAIPWEGYLTDVLTAKAVEFLGQTSDRPSFLYLAYHTPHWPMEVPKEIEAEFASIKDPHRRAYAAMMKSMDSGIGAVLDAVDRRGRPTLVLFVSDNGGPCYSSRGKAKLAMGENAASNAPLLGCKGTLYEGGIRVGMAMRWSGRLPAGAVVNWPASTLDFFPTICAAAGAKVPETVEGIDLLPLITAVNEAREPSRQLYWRFNTSFSRSAAVREGRWKLVRPSPGKQELFDIERDPGEKTNQIDAEPEVARRMNTQLDNWLTTLPRPRWIERLLGDEPQPTP